jgi:hypothetical protein
VCGRFGRKGDKQNIATAFHVKGGLVFASGHSLSSMSSLGVLSSMIFTTCRWQIISTQWLSPIIATSINLFLVGEETEL